MPTVLFSWLLDRGDCRMPRGLRAVVSSVAFQIKDLYFPKQLSAVGVLAELVLGRRCSPLPARRVPPLSAAQARSNVMSPPKAPRKVKEIYLNLHLAAEWRRFYELAWLRSPLESPGSPDHPVPPLPEMCPRCPRPDSIYKATFDFFQA